MAAELENTSEVRVNSYNPGGTRTGMRAAAYPAENPDTVKAPDAIIDEYIFLMSDAGHDTHGQALTFQN